MAGHEDLLSTINVKQFKSDEFRCNVKDNCLGRGTFGVVLAGFHRDRGGFRAIKLQKQQGLSKAQLEDELKMMILANHPNVVTVEGMVEWAGWIGIVMEHMECGSLQDLLFNDNVPDIAPVLLLRMCTEMSVAIAYLHKMLQHFRIAHGDLKPHNILLTSDLHCKVGDFGGAALSQHSVSSPADGGERLDVLGQGKQFTILFTAPERLLPNAKLSTAMDVYSFAIIVYIMLTRQDPLSSISSLRVFLFKISHEARFDKSDIERLKRELRESNRSKDREIIDLLDKITEECWKHDASDRPRMDNVRDRLQKVLNKIDPAAISRCVTNVLENIDRRPLQLSNDVLPLHEAVAKLEDHDAATPPQSDVGFIESPSQSHLIQNDDFSRPENQNLQRSLVEPSSLIASRVQHEHVSNPDGNASQISVSSRVKAIERMLKGMDLPPSPSSTMLPGPSRANEVERSSPQTVQETRPTITDAVPAEFVTTPNPANERINDPIAPPSSSVQDQLIHTIEEGNFVGIIEGRPATPPNASPLPAGDQVGDHSNAEIHLQEDSSFVTATLTPQSVVELYHSMTSLNPQPGENVNSDEDGSQSLVALDQAEVDVHSDGSSSSSDTNSLDQPCPSVEEAQKRDDSSTSSEVETLSIQTTDDSLPNDTGCLSPQIPDSAIETSAESNPEATTMDNVQHGPSCLPVETDFRLIEDKISSIRNMIECRQCEEIQFECRMLLATSRSIPSNPSVFRDVSTVVICTAQLLSEEANYAGALQLLQTLSSNPIKTNEDCELAERCAYAAGRLLQDTRTNRASEVKDHILGFLEDLNDVISSSQNVDVRTKLKAAAVCWMSTSTYYLLAENAKNPRRAKDLNQKAIAALEEGFGDKCSTFHVYGEGFNNLGNCYKELDEYTEAETQYFEATEVFQKAKDFGSEDKKIKAYQNAAECLVQLYENKLDLSRDIARKTYETLKQQNVESVTLRFENKLISLRFAILLELKQDIVSLCAAITSMASSISSSSSQCLDLLTNIGNIAVVLLGRKSYSSAVHLLECAAKFVLLIPDVNEKVHTMYKLFESIDFSTIESLAREARHLLTNRVIPLEQQTIQNISEAHDADDHVRSKYQSQCQLHLSYCYLKVEDYVRSCKLAQEAIDLLPTDLVKGLCYFILGMGNWHLKNYQETISSYSKAIEVWKDQPNMDGRLQQAYHGIEMANQRLHMD